MIYALNLFIILASGGLAGFAIHNMAFGKGLETVEKDLGLRPSERIKGRKDRALYSLFAQTGFGVFAAFVSYYFLGADPTIVNLYFNIASVTGVMCCPLLYWAASSTLRNSWNQKIF